MAGALAERLDVGDYPNAAGECQTVPGPTDTAVAYVVGLGEASELTPLVLEVGARRAALRHFRAAKTEETQADPGDGSDASATLHDDEPVGLSFPLLGSDSDLTVREGVRAVVRGVLGACHLLQRQGRVGVIAEIEFVEEHSDRAADALRAVRDLATAPSFTEGGLVVEHQPLLREIDGGLGLQLNEPDELTWPQRARLHVDDDDRLHFVLLTRRARAPARTLEPLWAHVDGQVREVTSTSRATSPDEARNIGGFLFEHLVPVQARPAFKQTMPLQLILDRRTARIPWELVRYDDPQVERPPATRFPITRQLSVVPSWDRPPESRGLRVMVAADLEGGPFALPGARREAASVARLFEGAQWTVSPPIIGPQAALKRLLPELLGQPPTVVHIAAHGLAGDNPGIVLPAPVPSADGQRSPHRLRGIHLMDLTSLPKLVFLNACHSGYVDQEQGGEFAPTMAEALIGAGIQAVVVSGWPVNDLAAQTFAETFWDLMLTGHPLGEAAQEARLRTWREYPEVNTWAAYQVYGDPGMRLPSPERDPLGTSGSILDTLRWQRARYRKSEQGDGDLVCWHGELRALTAGTDARLLTAEVCEALGRSWLHADAPVEAIPWLAKAIQQEQGGSFAAVELLLDAWTRRLGRIAPTEPKLARALYSRQEGPLLHGAPLPGPALVRSWVENLNSIKASAERNTLLGAAELQQAVRLGRYRRAELAIPGVFLVEVSAADVEGLLRTSLARYRAAAACQRFDATLVAACLGFFLGELDAVDAALELNEAKEHAIAARDSWWSAVIELDADQMRALVDHDSREDVADEERATRLGDELDDLDERYRLAARRWRPSRGELRATKDFWRLLLDIRAITRQAPGAVRDPFEDRLNDRYFMMEQNAQGGPRVWSGGFVAKR